LSVVLRLLSRLLLIPVVAGISYEFLRYSARNLDNRLVRVLIAPGLALQRLTTREPDLPMLECAIAALAPVLAADGIKVDLPARRPSVREPEVLEELARACVASEPRRQHPRQSSHAAGIVASSGNQQSLLLWLDPGQNDALLFAFYWSIAQTLWRFRQCVTR
jgi:hypothetical protein